MKRMTRIIVTALVIAVIGPNAAAATRVEVEGVFFHRSLQAGGLPLELKGYGLLRYMVFIKAYVGALYLPPSVSPDTVLEPVAKRLELQYFHAIKGEDFARATRIKIADNVTAFQLEQLQPRIDRLAGLYRDVQPGDRYSLTFVPGEGTRLALNGHVLGTIPGSDFARAVFAVWLGDNPIDKDFRETLLGVR